MNPLDIHLKFPDEATATSMMLETGLLQQVEDGEGNTSNIQGQGQMIDIIGPIYKATGTMLTDKEGVEYPEMADIGGWHVNMRGELPEAIAPYKITVSGTPYRIWD
jgi:hypothetical protein